jgi:phosphoenolpyruvate carboxykinase (ATP)
MSDNAGANLTISQVASSHGLENHGLTPRGTVHWNLAPAELYEHALARSEGRMVHGGGLAAVTAPHTGRSPNDKFTVREPASEETVDWGKVNVPMSREHYDVLKRDIQDFLNDRDLFVRDARAGADPEFGIKVRVVNVKAWHNLFCYNMFLRPTHSELEDFVPDWTILHAPDYQADPERHGTNSPTAIAVSFEDRTVLIAGSNYAGEMKKSIFSVLNYLLPDQGVLPMHCSANIGNDGDVALFFGLSGTGKTTLSADPERALIGDDEHGWTDHGVFNFEGGCYAKVIRLNPKTEPEIYAATQQFGTILENVVLEDDTRGIDFDNGEITENTRASYPLHLIPHVVMSGLGGLPKNVVFLTADAFGALPPLSRLTPAQAMYHFISGYTAKVAGTERGVTEPQATFSACFGAPFLPRHPGVYARMLGEKLEKHGVNVWLVNTGWSGGAYGVGERMSLPHTRAMVRAALAGRLDHVEFETDPVFGLSIPTDVPDVPSEVLNPRATWADGDAYDATAAKLAGMFHDNMKKYAEGLNEEILGAGPLVGGE